MIIDVLELLKDKALNEQEKYFVFRKRLEEYCSFEKRVFNLFRILKDIEEDLKECQNDKEQVNVDKSTVERLLRIIRIELRIIKYKIEYPEMTEDCKKFPIGEWTGNKADLIELVYAISLVKSVENGKVNVKTIKEAFEYIFGIDLGNISDRLDDIASRKVSRTRYLEKLVKTLNNFLDSMDSMNA